jgi:hypothetical protein
VKILKRVIALIKRRPVMFWAILVLGIPILLCISLVVFLQNSPQVSEDAVFCSFNDELYQLIKVQKDTWINNLRNKTPTSGGWYPAFDVWTANKQYGLVEPYYSYPAGSPEFYMITESLWPGTQSYGSRGYWYAPGKDMLTSSMMRYQHLEGDIYCYWYN